MESAIVTSENYSINYDLSDTSSNIMNGTLQAGKPTEFIITITENGQAVEGAKIEFRETNSYATFAPLQVSQTNLTNNIVGETYTNSSGIAFVTIIPSGSRRDTDFNKGEYYDMKLLIKIRDKYVY